LEEQVDDTGVSGHDLSSGKANIYSRTPGRETRQNVRLVNAKELAKVNEPLVFYALAGIFPSLELTPEPGTKVIEYSGL
jgi:hypothetical protein